MGCPTLAAPAIREGCGRIQPAPQSCDFGTSANCEVACDTLLGKRFKVSARPAGDSLEFSDIRVREWPPGHALDFADFDVLHARTLEGWTPLHFAAVVEHPVKPVVSENLYRPLFEGAAGEAVVLNEGPGDSDTLDVLLLYNNIKKPENDVWDFADNHWKTPLHYAVLFNKVARVRQLLAAKAYARHLNAADFHGKTAMHMAVCHPNPFQLTVTSLQTKEVLCRALEGCTPQPSIEVIKTLAESPVVDLGAVDCCLYTPLHWAVHVGYPDAVRCLVSLGNRKRILPTQKDVQGRTAMAVASELEITAVHKKASPSPHNQKHFNFRYFNWEVGDDQQQNLNDFNTLAINHMNERVIPPVVVEEIRAALLTCDEVKNDMDRLQKQKQDAVNGTNAISVAATLVAAATSQGMLQIPDGNKTDRSLYMFWVIGSFSFAICTLLSGVTVVFSSGKNIFGEITLDRQIGGMTRTYFLLYISMYFFAIAFFEGVLALNLSSGLSRNLTFHSYVPYALIMLALPSISVYYFVLRSLLILKRRGVTSYWGPIPQKIDNLFKTKIETIRERFKRSWEESWSQHRLPVEIEQDHAEIESILDRIFSSEQVEPSLHMPKAGPKDEDTLLDVLRRVYEQVRIELHSRSTRSWNNMRFLSDSGLSPREIHFWIGGCTAETCRIHSLKVDREC